MPRSRFARYARRVAIAAVVVLLAYYALCLVLLAAYRFFDPPITGVQLQRHVEAAVAQREYHRRQTVVPASRIPRNLARAVVAAEDGRFWTHWGFDVREMQSVGEGVLQGDRPRGASTITQQLVKNLFGYTYRFPLRKLYEIALTPPAELILGKQRILELYLNNVEWGDGVFGAEAAARHHYGVSARNLSRTQAAGLAALLPNPRARTPANTPQYRAEILRRMAHRGW
jgi:monofunctional biosynthetic peptidoglycan transglycosylase